MRALDLAVLQNGDPTATPPVLSLAAAFALLLGCPCVFETQPLEMQTGACARVNLIGSWNVVDELVQTRVAPTAPDGPLPAGGVQEVLYGIRERTIQVTALSAIDQTLDRSARALLEMLEDRLKFTSTANLFGSLGLALIGRAPIQIIDPSGFGRVSSAASIDLQFRFGKRTADTAIPRIVRTTVRGVVDDRVDDPITAVLERP